MRSHVLISALLFICSVAGVSQRDHQLILDPGMNVDTQYVMLSETNPLSAYYGRGSWVKKSIAIPDNSPTNELQALSIDSSGATDPRTVAISILNGNTIKFLDRSGLTDHGLLTGLGDDDHTQYPLLLGRSSGQTLIGGTGTTDDLILQTTSGVGASGADMIFKVGNNGATEAMTILNNGYVGIGINSPLYNLHLKGSMLIEASAVTNHSMYFNVLRNGATQTYFINQLASTESANMDLIVRYIPQGTGGRTAYQVWAGNDVANDGYLEFSHLGTEVQFKSNKTGTGTIAPINFLIGSTSSMYINTSANIGVGTTSISAKLHTLATTEQLRVGYDASNYCSTTVGSTGTTTLDAVGAGAKFVFSDDIQANTTVLPDANDGAVLGSSALSFSDLFLASGAVINFNAGDVTVTHSANALTVAGGKAFFPDRINIATHTPANASDTGMAGDVAWDAAYIYICTATNTWVRSALTTW